MSLSLFVAPHHQIWASPRRTPAPPCRIHAPPHQILPYGLLQHRIPAPWASSPLHAHLLPRSTSHHCRLVTAALTRAHCHAPPPETMSPPATFFPREEDGHAAPSRSRHPACVHHQTTRLWKLHRTP
ncbi:hypothetical protein COCNU_scaffold001459G000020 [Cocos nucifera]|nr:hypothetical protein [Cocos nucifera]